VYGALRGPGAKWGTLAKTGVGEDAGSFSGGLTSAFSRGATLALGDGLQIASGPWAVKGPTEIGHFEAFAGPDRGRVEGAIRRRQVAGRDLPPQCDMGFRQS